MNIILIISDTYRYDNLFDRAQMPVRTPNLDKFNEQAVSLDRLYTGSFPTIPHRTDLTTGRHGWPWYGWQPLVDSSKNNIPSLLAQNGYVSQLLCDCPHLFPAGFDKSFSAACAVRGQEGDMPFLRMNHPIKETMPREKTRSGHHFQDSILADLHRWTNMYWRGAEDTFALRTSRLAGEWLEENCDHDPFFLWVDLFDPHEPWDPPEYMVEKYNPGYTGTAMIHPNYGMATDYTPDELRNLRAHYCAEAELVDKAVGRVLDKINDLGLWDNSIVVFTTDHGMSLGEHNRTGKTNINDSDSRNWPIYPEVAHIPFIIAAPGVDGGRTVSSLLQPADILPTLLELSEQTVQPPVPFHGRSFAAQVRGDSTDAVRDVAITASKMKLSDDGGIPAKATTPVLYTEEWAYVPIGVEGTPELFALENDPYAEQNIADDNPDTVKELHERLIAWLKEIDAPQETIAVFEA